MSNGHTPGPWEYCDDTGEIVAGAAVICTVDDAELEDRVPDEAKLESFANARLIAAAPDLLADLEELLDAYEDGTNQCCCDNSGHASPAPCLVCRVRDDLAKAKGADHA